MSSPPEEPKPAILHDPSSRSADSNPPALPPTTVAHAPYRQNAPMIHPRLPRTDAPAAGVSDHLTTTWSQDDQGRPVTLHHSWHPNHPAREPHSGAANYYMQRESRPHRSSPDYFQYRRPPSRQQFGYRNYEDQNRMKSQYNHRSEPSNAYYEAKRLEQEAFRKDYESKTGLLLPPHSAEIAPVAYTQPAARHMAPTNNGSGCSCKKSKCLKLYCACFSSSVLCRADCKCEGCLNSNDEVAKKDNAIQVARRAVLDRNPKAFDDKIGQSGVTDVGIVRPVFSRAIPVRRMPEYDFRSLERVRTDSISPKEGLMPALPPLASATPAVAPVQLEEPKKTANEESSAKESDVGDEATEEKDAPDESKDDDNATEKSEGASKSPDQTHAELASVSTSGSTSRPVVFNRNPSPHDGYYRPSPTYRQPFAWDARHYPREMELRRHSYSYYDQQSLSSMPHHSAESRMPREMHPYQYRPHTALPLTDAHLPKQHRVGCKCKKSMCLKKYCECFQNGIKCGMSCKCVNCGNKPGAVKNANGAEQTQDQATEDAVNTMVSLGQTVSLESEETPNLHRSSEDNEPSVVGRPPSLPSITSTSHHTDGEESLKENPKPGEQNLDFLATLATSALDDLKRDKRKAEEMELSRAVSLEAENKRSRASVSYDYYDNSYNQSYRWANSNEHTLKSITTQVHNQTATPAPVPKEKSTSEGTKSSKLPKGLTFRKVCSNCGRQRAEHGEFGFGNKCPLTTCGKCGADSQCHQINKVRMGVMCTLTESDGAIAGCSAKYEAVLADLAARAEIRAEIGRAE